MSVGLPLVGERTLEGLAMPLSKDEKLTLDGIERALLATDPRMADAISFESARRRQRRRMTSGGYLFLFGLIALLAGAVATQSAVAFGITVSVAGFSAMVLSAAVLLRARGSVV